MIFRKPYAFLIKNFRKIHIGMLIISAFLYYKTIKTSSFISDFMEYMSYDPYVESISKYLSPLFYLSLITAIIVSFLLMIVLIRKDKPWKLYIIPTSIYMLLFILSISIYNYFSNFDGVVVAKDIKILADTLHLVTFPQYIIFGILLIRITGLDIHKFGFKNDKEFLELDQDDRAEFEVSFSFDKYALKRLYKKIIRSIGYFYEEHRFIMNIVIVISLVILLGNIYYFFGIKHKTIKENNTLYANNYALTINKSYYTNKDKAGNIIEKDSAFVIINITIQNNTSRRKIDADDFHLKNGTTDITYAGNIYNNYFDDLGKGGTITELRKGEKRTIAMIFKVDKNLDKEKFTLYYQQYRSSSDVYLRKIKINPIDLSNIIKNKKEKLGDELKVTYPNNKTKSFTLEEMIFEDEAQYNIESCDKDDNCSVVEKTIKSNSNKKILKISFYSEDYEGKELIDFSNNYGKIKYVDNENITRVIGIEDILKSQDYLGKYLYIEVPASLEQSKVIEFIYTLRNQKYYYKIR